MKSEIALGHVSCENLGYTEEIEPLVGRKRGKRETEETSINKRKNVLYSVVGTCFDREDEGEVKDYGMWTMKRIE